MRKIYCLDTRVNEMAECKFNNLVVKKSCETKGYEILAMDVVMANGTSLSIKEGYKQIHHNDKFKPEPLKCYPNWDYNLDFVDEDGDEIFTIKVLYNDAGKIFMSTARGEGLDDWCSDVIGSKHQSVIADSKVVLYEPIKHGIINVDLIEKTYELKPRDKSVCPTIFVSESAAREYLNATRKVVEFKGVEQTFVVDVHYSGFRTYEVKATSLEEAKEKARDGEYEKEIDGGENVDYVSTEDED